MKEQRIPKLWENLNATWGGETGNGLIEDPSVTKEVGKMYIGSDGKAYICLVPSNINNSTNYIPCNVVDTTKKLNDLIYKGYFSSSDKNKFRFLFELSGYSISSADITGRYVKIYDQYLLFGRLSVNLDKTFQIPNDNLMQIAFHKSIVPGLESVPSRDIFGTATIKCENQFDSAAIGASISANSNDGYINFFSGEYNATGDANLTIKQDARNITIYFSVIH